MSILYQKIIAPGLFAFDAEVAHGLSIKALKTGLTPRFNGSKFPSLKVKLGELEFPNPLGMAAGYDKNADVPDALLGLGFGHVEVGTVTPHPQSGNPKPRIFRLREDQAVINRLGFNSKGHDLVASRLSHRDKARGIVGINLGANKSSEDFAADYVAGIKAFSPYARYFTINISSPNTPGLRALQGANPLADLLGRVSDARNDAFANKKPVPVFLKIAPDLDQSEMDDIAEAVLASDIDALIVSNTTLSRAGLKNARHAAETGGLSGKPLFEKSTIALAQMYQRVGHKMPLIGVGGIHDVQTAFNKIEAGASLIQLYSAMVYEGPTLPAQILTGLDKKIRQEGFASISQLTGRKAGQWVSIKAGE